MSTCATRRLTDWSTHHTLRSGNCIAPRVTPLDMTWRLCILLQKPARRQWPDFAVDTLSCQLERPYSNLDPAAVAAPSFRRHPLYSSPCGKLAGALPLHVRPRCPHTSPPFGSEVLWPLFQKCSAPVLVARPDHCWDVRRVAVGGGRSGRPA